MSRSLAVVGAAAAIGLLAACGSDHRAPLGAAPATSPTTGAAGPVTTVPGPGPTQPSPTTGPSGAATSTSTATTPPTTTPFRPPATSPSGSAVLADAYVRTVAAGSGSVVLHGSVQVATGRVTLGGSGTFTFSPPYRGQAAVTSSAQGQRMVSVERLVGTTVYVRLPSAGILGHGKSWIASSGSALAGTTGGTGGLTADPPQALEVVAGAATNVVPVGSATVDDVATHAYTAVIDIARVAASEPAGVAATLRREAAATGVSAIPVEVWIDAQGRVRRLTERYTVARTREAVVASIDIVSFGVSVHVTAPPPSTVATLPGAG